MPRFLKITSGIIVAVLLGLFCLIGWFWLDHHLAWKKAAKNPFVQDIGAWGGETYQSAVKIDTSLLPSGTSRDDWVAIMESHDFGIDKDEANCRWSNVNGLPDFSEYDMCAAQMVGDPGLSGCSYIYTVASKFENDVLTSAIGSHSYFMCM